MTQAAIPIRIEAGSSADLDRVVEVMRSAFDDRYGEGWTRSQCAGILPMPGVRLLLARLPDGGIAGFSLIRTVQEEGELLLLAVAPAFRRRGIGRNLLAQFVKHCENSGIRNVHLEVRDGNPAIAMYRSAGFAEVGRRPNYYRGNDSSQHDALTFSLKLGQ